MIVGFGRIAKTELRVLSFDYAVVGVVQGTHCFAVLRPALAFGDGCLRTVFLFWCGEYLDCFIVGVVVLRGGQLGVVELEEAFAAGGVAHPPLGAGDAVDAVTFMCAWAWDGAVALVEPAF